MARRKMTRLERARKWWYSTTNLEEMLHQVSERKQHLFALAACRDLLWNSLPEPSKQGIAKTEQYIDERITKSHFNLAVRAADHASIGLPFLELHYARMAYAAMTCNIDYLLLAFQELRGEQNNLRYILYEIAGDPFRPQQLLVPLADTSIAQSIYDTQNWAEMPVLADWLEEQGCTNDDVLYHLREKTTTHCKGCWVLDLLLGY